MKKEHILGIGILAVVIVAALWAANTRVAQSPSGEGKACTMEAKLCPDGSAVGRTGPNCEFAECPTVVATSTTTGGGTTGGGTGGGILPYKSGVRGTVLLGPTCPVMRDPPDPQCAERGYATTIAVYRSGSNSEFAMGKSDANGTFEFSLPPGSYMLAAGNSMNFPRCASADVTVAVGGYITQNISCDTGIR